MMKKGTQVCIKWLRTLCHLKRYKKKLFPFLRRIRSKKAVLFGSYARNNVTNNSDIDLYIDTDGRLRGLDFVGLLEHLVNILRKNVDLIDKSHIEPNSLILQEIEHGGIVLYEKSNDLQQDSELVQL
ncbi:nucleotidyltransferase domain-containing protein [Dehalobacterium formicoaceticum]|uniref:Nucleotidyltransferase domain-containing protein n=1 Tax=Dehalobacterium formicoaceticum TaxID=51515 RepID=A0ABT1Y370_9FIRM|nr:nucleotidyltransferase domain-containing protein [Dehalobacterium formicoaceticum]MCR6544600.1 nucleotidyltransferase domain-containing protein [Dehalobacterium formicoaceticum]